MNKKFIIIILIVIGVVGLFLIRNTLTKKLAEIQKSGDVIVGNIKKDILAPPPLRAISESDQAYLTRNGVINWTNVQRTNVGLPSLAENYQLNAAAKLKVQDMFARQYFEHVSPTGGNIGTLLDGVGYAYIAVGENLALGNFKNDQALVQAWMDSPGHRANILNVRFKEIGVAVAKGMFEGHQTWLAVQAFALPLSACPQADASLKSQINQLEVQVAQLKVSADMILAEMDTLSKGNNRDAYNQKVREYNALVNQLNNFVAQLKESVAQYNEQVRVFNICTGQ